MEIQEGPLQVETLPDAKENTTQPIPATSEPSILNDEAAVRAALVDAEAKGMDPEKVRIRDISQGPQVPVPEKFQKPTGEVDVEKLKASTQALDEAIQKKESEIQKSVEEYLSAYKEKEAKFRNLPNPEKLAASLPPPVPAPVLPPPAMDTQSLKQRILEDLNKDPVDTMTNLIDLIVEKKMQPVKEDYEKARERERDNAIRENIKSIASKDPRVLDPKIFQAINAKLESDPDYWKLKNPHKAAWLDVKDEMRLGDLNQSTAQPSRPPTPILGGGTPPPPQSSQGELTPKVFVSALNQVNVRDKAQMDALEKSMREYLERNG